MWVRRLRRRPNIKAPLGKRLVFAWNLPREQMNSEEHARVHTQTPEDQRHWTNVVLRRGQRHQRWPSTKTQLCDRLVFAGLSSEYNPLQDNAPGNNAESSVNHLCSEHD